MKCPQVINSLVLLQFVIVSLANDEEIEKRRTSNVCHFSVDCPSNSFCEPRSGGADGQCVCHDGYFMRSSGKLRECIQIADYGELCYMNKQCEFRLGLEAECKNGQCACREGAHYNINENGCFNSSKIGEYCRLTSNCVTEFTTCVKGYCQCPSNYHSNWEKNRCVKSVDLEETCEKHEECIAENSICYGVCRCRTSHIMSDDRKRCLPIARTLYQPCQEDTQCENLQFSFCGSNNTCTCRAGHHDINSRCHVSVRLGEICEDDVNCIIAHSSCVDKRCRCDEGFSQFRGRFCSAADKVQISSLVLISLLSFVRLLKPIINFM